MLLDGQRRRETKEPSALSLTTSMLTRATHEDGLGWAHMIVRTNACEMAPAKEYSASSLIRHTKTFGLCVLVSKASLCLLTSPVRQLCCLTVMLRVRIREPVRLLRTRTYTYEKG